MSNLNQVHHLYFSIITQSISISINFTVKSPNLCNHYCNLIHIFLSFHPWTILVLYSCHPGGTTLEPYMYSKWVDTVPLSKVRGQIFLPGKPMRGKPQSISNQKGSSPCLKSGDRWSQSQICWPLQITVDWPIKRLSSRDGTYISVSCNDHNTFQYTNPFQYFNITSTSSTLTIPFNISMSTFQFFPQLTPQHLKPNI